MGRTQVQGSAGMTRAAVQDAGTFMAGSSGRWAGEQLLKALQAGRPLTTSELRTADTLRVREWIHLDNELVKAAMLRMTGIADLRAAGLTRPVAGGMGKTMYQYERLTNMGPAAISMDGMAKSDNERQEYDLVSLPLPIIHKDFYINLRTLMASRTTGDPLDVTQVENAGRMISETQEYILFNGGPQFGGAPIYGYNSHPDRNIIPYGTHGVWTETAVTGEDMLQDIINAIATLEADRMYGPYAVYIGTGFNSKLNGDFKAMSALTIRARVQELEQIKQYGIRVADQMPAGKIAVVQMTSDTVVLVDAEPLQTIQWDIEGGFMINFKAFMVSIPLIRSDTFGHCGVCIIQADEE